MKAKQLLEFGLLIVLVAPGALAQKYKTEIPPAVTTPDSIETRLGTLKFKGGFPDDATVEKVYDNLDFQRGVEAFLNTMPAASLSAMRKGIREFGPDNTTILIFEKLMDSRSLFLTANTDSIYATAWIDLKNGPIVIETPPNTLGIVDDFWFRYVADLGNAGPDNGKGGKFLFLPPDYKGENPKGYFVFKSPTLGNWFMTRGFLVNGDPAPAVESIKKHLRIYPLAQGTSPHVPTFVNVSGKAFNTTHSMDFSFYDEVNQVVQEEPSNAIDPETSGLLASIGIEKGKPFEPDERMKKILTESAAVGQATARALAYRTRTKEAQLFPKSAWENLFVGGSYEFLSKGARLLDPRTSFYFCATGVTPAMATKMVGTGSQYATAFVDAKKQPLDGNRNYKLHLPPNTIAFEYALTNGKKRRTPTKLKRKFISTSRAPMGSAAWQFRYRSARSLAKPRTNPAPAVAPPPARSHPCVGENPLHIASP
jgi:hypothetical protein